MQNEIERAGVSTVQVTHKPEITLYTRVPRAAYVRFPLGNPMGEACAPDQQRAMLLTLLEIVEQAEQPERVYELPYRWRRWNPNAQGPTDH